MRPLTKISLFGVRLATCVLCVYWLALFTGTHLPTIPIVTPKISDKLMHFSGFFGLAFLMCWVVPTRTHAFGKFSMIAIVALSYAAFDELSQGFVRGRTTDLYDFFADTAGIFAAISVYATARYLYIRVSRAKAKKCNFTTRKSFAAGSASSAIDDKTLPIDRQSRLKASSNANLEAKSA